VHMKRGIRLTLACVLTSLALPAPAFASCESDQSGCEEACKSDMSSSAGQYRGLNNRQAAALVGILGVGTAACISQCERQYDDCQEEERDRQVEQRRQEEERRQAQVRQQEQQRAQAEQIRKQQEQQRVQQAQAAQRGAQDDKGLRWLAEGFEHYKRKEYADAADFLESGLKLLPDNAEGRYYAAMTYLAMNKAREAEEHALRYLALEPDSPYANKLKRSLPNLAARQQAEQKRQAEARAKREAEVQARERERAERRASRPQLPVAVSEAVWQALEDSEAYRNRPMPPRQTIRKRYNDKNSFCINTVNGEPSDTGFSCTNDSFVIDTLFDGRGWRHDKFNIDSKSYDHVGGTPRLNIQMSYGVSRHESMSTLAGLLPLSRTERADMLHYYPGDVEKMVIGPGSKSTVIDRIGIIDGNLFPLKAGARLRLEWQEREHVAFDSGVAVVDKISTVKKSCEVTGKQPASTLFPQLKGQAWKISCVLERSDFDKPMAWDSFYLEETGYSPDVVLHLVDRGEGKPKAYVLPQGQFKVKNLGPEFGNLSQTIEGFSVEIVP
jgi:tetratricopeptide (TPR) repeat protein